MPVAICPTITAETAEEYHQQMEQLELFATRLHVDVADGQFAPRKLVPFDQIWWRGNRTIDLHVMYQRPLEYTEIILALAPRLVIMQAEAEGNFVNFARRLKNDGIEVGMALLPNTAVQAIESALEWIDHVLIFSGNLGYQGGSTANLGLLDKVKKLRRLKPTVEIGWDGGINDQNARALTDGGVDVLNVGGFIASAPDPAAAYATLEALTR